MLPVLATKTTDDDEARRFKVSHCAHNRNYPTSPTRVYSSPSLTGETSHGKMPWLCKTASPTVDRAKSQNAGGTQGISTWCWCIPRCVGQYIVAKSG